MLEVNQLVGNYRIVGLMSQGGAGMVYEAVHQYIGRRAAIKVLHPTLSVNPQLCTRFLNEARAVNLVRHPGLVEIFEYGFLPAGPAYILMEHLSGESLYKRLQRLGPHCGPAELHLARQIALALAAAHERGVTHRDLKPENVMVIEDPEQPYGERAKVLDFGIARFMPPGAHSEPRLTREGMTLGTAEYMSPEQCTGSAVDGQTDVYALGVILYQMGSGKLPFAAEQLADLMALHVSATPEPLHKLRSDIPEGWAQLVQCMMAKDPRERPAMAEVAAQLRLMLEPEAAPFPSRPRVYLPTRQEFGPNEDDLRPTIQEVPPPPRATVLLRHETVAIRPRSTLRVTPPVQQARWRGVWVVLPLVSGIILLIVCGLLFWSRASSGRSGVGSPESGLAGCHSVGRHSYCPA